MPTEVIMPQMGFDMVEGTVIRWLKAEGDEVARGEPIVEIETDKATVEVEAFASGVLRKIAAEEGTTVPVGQIIGIIASAGEDIPEVETPVTVPSTIDKPTVVKAPSEPAGDKEAPAVDAAAQAKEDRVLASPIARRLAEEKGIDLALVSGTGPRGRITKEDVLAFESAPEAAPKASPPTAPAPSGEVQNIELSRMRKTIARRMTQSKQEMPHFYVTSSIDMGRAVAMRQELIELWEGDVRVTVNDLIVKATALALQRHPNHNAYYDDGVIKQNSVINVGIAVALDDGLIAPAILDCGNKSLKEIALASRDLVSRAKGGVLKPEEYTSATIAVSNLGMFDVDSFIAIINPMQCASVAVGSVQQQAVVRDGEIVVASMMQATISADHRVVNGAEAALFLNEIKGFLERPSSLLA